jgi:hypothetical protein
MITVQPIARRDTSYMIEFRANTACLLSMFSSSPANGNAENMLKVLAYHFLSLTNQKVFLTSEAVLAYHSIHILHWK